MNNLFAVSLPKSYMQSPLSTNVITSLDCNENIYLFIAYLCSTFACGCASAGREKQIVANVINGGVLSILSLKPFTFLLFLRSLPHPIYHALRKVINNSIFTAYKVGTDLV
jgi:hypothetical protein